MTKELYERNKNLVTEKLCGKKINIYTKNITNGSVSKLPKNDSHIINQTYTLNLKNSCKSCNLIPSYNGNFKVRRCPVNNETTPKKVSKF